MALSVLDRLFVVVYGAEDPSDGEWRGYLDLVERHGIRRTMQLIYTEGGAPTAAQRRALNQLIAGHTVPVAVISARAGVRWTVTVLSWFNRRIRAFPPVGFRDALAYLEIPVSRTGLIAREIHELRLSLGLDELVALDVDARQGEHDKSGPGP
jgi:hypothetical protein